MKKKILFVSLSVLLCLCGCLLFYRGEMRKANLKYLTEEEFTEAFRENGIASWILEKALPEQADGEYMRKRYDLYSRDGEIACQFHNFCRKDGASELRVYFLYGDGQGISKERHERFLETELPQIWLLAAEFCDDEELAVRLGKRLQDTYGAVLAPEQYKGRFSYEGRWGAQEGGLYMEAVFHKGDPEWEPEWNQILLTGEELYNQMETEKESGVQELLDVSVLDAAGMAQTYYVSGRLKDIRPNGDFSLEEASYDKGLPGNTDFYQSAVLVGEEGSLPVYIAPTALTEEELSEKRLHRVRIVRDKNWKKCYIIDGSMLLK